MLRLSSLATALVAVLVVGGCELNVENPNAPDAPRAFADPAGLQQLLGGSFRVWVGTRGDYFGALPMTAMADNYTASWNNAAIRFYSSVGSDCPSRCGWNNSATAPEAAGGPSVESQWYGYYTVLAAANNVLLGVADGVCFDDDCATDNTLTSRNTAIAKMMQGMAFAGIALVYDQGFLVDETTPPTDPSAIPFSTRAELRDAALQKFGEAWTEAGLKTWATPIEWMGVGAGKSYSNDQTQRLIRTMQAELVAMWPRNAAENAAANWAQVATFASQGISSGTAFDWEFYIDVSGRECGDLDCVKTWGNSIGTMRVDTRVARLLDPATQEDPWPENNPLTRLTAPVTASPSPQDVTPLSMAGITTGRYLSIGCAPLTRCSGGGEKVLVLGTTPTTFSAVFAKNHQGPTTLTGGITKDTVPQAATPGSMAGIEAGSFLLIDDLANAEPVTVISVTATTFTALFTNSHSAGAVVAKATHRNGGSSGNECPLESPDKRLGNGTYGPKDDFNGYATLAATANAGSDFACSGVPIFPPARGQYHQSNLQHVRYQHLAYRGENLPGFDATGQDPFYTRQMNDLLWAEGLIRSGGNLGLAAQLIDNSRVGRGGLPSVAGGTPAQLLAALQYEQEIEFMGQGPTPFFNRRRVDGLISGTPRHMPVPGRELDVLARAIYTFGGPGAPDMSGAADLHGRRGVRTVREIWIALRQAAGSRRF
ncbi:MAG: hypothetical protein ACREMM_06275 [Gemmatimonadales bacterium]